MGKNEVPNTPLQHLFCEKRVLPLRIDFQPMLKDGQNSQEVKVNPFTFWSILANVKKWVKLTKKVKRNPLHHS